MAGLFVSGAEVYDGYNEESFLCKVDILGFLADLPSHHENIGEVKSFSNSIIKFCFRCWASSSEKTKLGKPKDVKDLLAIFDIADTLTDTCLHSQVLI